MNLLDAAHNAAWAIARGFIAWLRCLPRNHGSLHALGCHLRVWWRLRQGRQVITRTERTLGIQDRWHP